MLYLIPEFLNVCLPVFKIACCQDFLVSRFQKCKLSRFQVVKISRCHGFKNARCQDFNFYWSQFFIYSIIKDFFQSVLIYYCQESCKAIFQANKYIKSNSFLICLRLALSDLLCPVFGYSTVQKQKLILHYMKRENMSRLYAQSIMLITFAFGKWQVVFWAAWNSFSSSKWLALSGEAHPPKSVL